jgi:hydrogenase nickel incorporation protein HypA/HybF
MHEFGLCQGVLEVVEKRAAGRNVSRITVRIGVRHRVAAPAFEQAFSFVSDGTVAEGAEVDLVLVPALVTCGDCANQSETEDEFAACPQCGSANLRIEGGDDLMLESIAVRPQAEMHSEQK